MKIWVLKPTQAGEAHQWWDCCDRFVIAAPSAIEAREIAQDHAGWNEEDDVCLGNECYGLDGLGAPDYDNPIGYWTDPKLTSCREVKPGKRPRIICDSYNRG